MGLCLVIPLKTSQKKNHALTKRCPNGGTADPRNGRFTVGLPFRPTKSGIQKKRTHPTGVFQPERVSVPFPISNQASQVRKVNLPAWPVLVGTLRDQRLEGTPFCGEQTAIPVQTSPSADRHEAAARCRRKHGKVSCEPCTKLRRSPQDMRNIGRVKPVQGFNQRSSYPPPPRHNFPRSMAEIKDGGKIKQQRRAASRTSPRQKGAAEKKRKKTWSIDRPAQLPGPQVAPHFAGFAPALDRVDLLVDPVQCASGRSPTQQILEVRR